MVEGDRVSMFQEYQSAGGMLSQNDFLETRTFLDEVKGFSNERLDQELRTINFSDESQYRYQSKIFGTKFSYIGLAIYGYLHRYETRVSSRSTEFISKTRASSDREVFEEVNRLIELYGNM